MSGLGPIWSLRHREKNDVIKATVSRRTICNIQRQISECKEVGSYCKVRILDK